MVRISSGSGGELSFFLISILALSWTRKEENRKYRNLKHAHWRVWAVYNPDKTVLEVECVRSQAGSWGASVCGEKIEKTSHPIYPSYPQCKRFPIRILITHCLTECILGYSAAFLHSFFLFRSVLSFRFEQPELGSMLITKMGQRLNVELLAAGTPTAPTLKNTSYHCMPQFHHRHFSYSCLCLINCNSATLYVWTRFLPPLFFLQPIGFLGWVQGALLLPLNLTKWLEPLENHNYSSHTILICIPIITLAFISQKGRNCHGNINHNYYIQSCTNYINLVYIITIHIKMNSNYSFSLYLKIHLFLSLTERG
jgi:hypothetical protein